VLVSQTAITREERLERFVRWSEWPLAILALALIPSILLDELTTGAGWHWWAEVLNWIVWLAFCTELGISAWLQPQHFFRRSWFDLLIVLFSPPFLGPEYLQGVRAVRVFRSVRVLRAFRLLRVLAIAGIALENAKNILQRRRFHYVVLATTITLFIGALAVYSAEHGRNEHINTVGDALWWSVVTATTVGYGDISPTTTEGRFIAIGLMLVGVGFIGIFTATIASFILDPNQERHADNFTRLEERLTCIEQHQAHIITLLTERKR
jgi:voltage-gated potassium channel